MRVDRDAAAVVGDGEVAAFLELDLDEGRVAGDRLVHRVVDHLGEEVVQRLLVGAADIHAGPAADRLQALQHLDGGGVVAGSRRGVPACGAVRETFAGGVAGEAARGALGCCAPEEIVVVSVIGTLVRDDDSRFFTLHPCRFYT